MTNSRSASQEASQSGVKSIGIYQHKKLLHSFLVVGGCVVLPSYSGEGLFLRVYR